LGSTKNMKFMLLLKSDENTGLSGTPGSRLRKYNQELIHAGVLLAAGNLLPAPQGTPVRGGVIEGFWIIQVKSTEEALEWARRLPAEKGGIAVSQVFDWDLPEQA
jgi:hypothetical protein